MAEIVKLRSTLKDIPLAKMRVSDSAQRILRSERVAYLHSVFDPEELGYPVVNLRNGHYFIVDGQHRIEAAKLFLGKGWEGQSITCRAYSGLTEQQEAEMFDRLNNYLTVNAFDKFRVRVTAGRPAECAVKKIVEKTGLKVSTDKSEGSISCVTTLVKIYTRADGPTLGRALKLVHESFGDPGLVTGVVDGLARVCERYNGTLDDATAIERLRTVRGGVGSIMARASLLRKQTGVSVPECIAAATVDTLNAQKGGKKLPAWWKE